MMQRSSIDKTKALIAEDLQDVPAVALACSLIVDFVAREADENLEHLTFGMLSKASNSDKRLTSRAIAYLAGERAKVLAIRFEFIDEEDKIYPLDPSVVSEARELGEFIHPDEGEPVENFESHIYMYFTPSWVGGVN